MPDGGTTAILTARDISERIDVQARLTRIAGDERRQAAELRAVIQAMGEGILVVDPTGRVSLANDAAAAILGELPIDLADLAPRLGPLNHVGSGPDEAEPGSPPVQTVACPMVAGSSWPPIRPTSAEGSSRERHRRRSWSSAT